MKEQQAKPKVSKQKEIPRIRAEGEAHVCGCHEYHKATGQLSGGLGVYLELASGMHQAKNASLWDYVQSKEDTPLEVWFSLQFA